MATEISPFVFYVTALKRRYGGCFGNQAPHDEVVACFTLFSAAAGSIHERS